jgi:hypothetical protein
MTLSDVLMVVFPFTTPLPAALASAGGILIAVILVRNAMPPMLPRRSPRSSDAWKVALIVLAGFLAAWSVANAALALRLI